MNKPNKSPAAIIEEQILDIWEKEKTFQQSLELRKNGKHFEFYDGPPFANGVPHYGHLVQTTIKDSFTRYKTMQGYYVPRRVGWDTHGLPVEYAIEKEHGFRGKKDIVAYGIDKFNQECRDSVFKYKDLWERMFKRAGRWADYDKTYATLDERYIESVWWVFKTIYDKGLIYKDFRSSPYCPRCATPLSNFELNQGYQDGIKDPSLYVKFKLTEEDAYLLGWTTTPWSLPGNAAIAVKPDALYAYVSLNNEDKKETVVIAKECIETLDADTYKIDKIVAGRELVGKQYEPLFTLSNLSLDSHNDDLYKVWGAEFVSTEDGTGILHVAPAFGEDDLLLGKQHNLPVLITVDENGHILKDAGLPESFAGKFFKSADASIIEYLTKQNRVYAAGTLEHTYPFCWRCDTPLLYYATDSWLVKVSNLRADLVKNNQVINWTPGHIKNGRFGKWLENARDWAISRNRFWGAPLPVWVTEDGEVLVVGSVEELRQRAVKPETIGDLHRPYIDDIKLKTDSGKIATRIPEVFDCWFESGAMPYAQDHYPFEGKASWDKRFPSDFIAEAIDQTRGWFYTLHVLATALFDKPAYKNVICSGWIVAADGEKLSKRKKNYAPMDEIFDQYGVDTLRFFMASSPIVNGEDVRFSTDFLRDVQRKVFMTLQNTHNFYKLYADVDAWQPSKNLEEPTSDNMLDTWALSRLNQTISEVTEGMETFRLDKATRPIEQLLDDVSNWYVRRSRRRFWKSEDDSDKQKAYETLHYVLIRLCQLLAPFSPFLSDYIWRQLAEGTSLPSSVHLSDWPKEGKVNSNLDEQMETLRKLVTVGLSLRAEHGIKVRQPLASVSLSDGYKTLPAELVDVLKEELNVHQVVFSPQKRKPATAEDSQASGTERGEGITLDAKITPALKSEGVMRDVVRHVQNARKSAGLDVDDRIHLNIDSHDEAINKAVNEYAKIISQETLALSLNSNQDTTMYRTEVKVDGVDVRISLAKAS